MVSEELAFYLQRRKFEKNVESRMTEPRQEQVHVYSTDPLNI
jgi:hypothetical protein